MILLGQVHQVLIKHKAVLIVVLHLLYQLQAVLSELSILLFE